MSSAKSRRIRDIIIEILNLTNDLYAKLRVLGDDAQADKTLAYIKAKGISPIDVYTALIDTYGTPVEEPPLEAKV